MNGLITEREWRKRYVHRVKNRPDWWGAQYLLPTKVRKKFYKNYYFYVVTLVIVITAGLLFLRAALPKTEERFEDVALHPATAVIQPRPVSSISYMSPVAMEWYECTFTQSELYRGKMLVLDENHPLPAGMLPPNTFSIAAYGKGMVPVADLGIQSGKETIDALQELFAALRNKNVNGLRVQQGTQSVSQQKAARLKLLREWMHSMPAQQAVEKVLQETDHPAAGEMLREFTVELRFQNSDQSMDERAFETFMQGQALLQTAWRYGFIRTDPAGSGTRAFRFRYTGKAHATAITYLNLTFAQYLECLHEKKTLTVYEGDKPKYLILCKEMTGSHISFNLPTGAVYEASIDNLGYAIVACTL